MCIYGRAKHSYKNVRNLNRIKIKIGNNNIKVTDNFKYLGVTLHKNYNFNLHIENVIIKEKRSLSAYYNLIRPPKSIAPNIKLICYKQLIRPTLSYAFPIWHDISPRKMEVIRIFERKCLRMCLNMTKYRNEFNNIKNYSNKILYEKCQDWINL